MFISSSAHATTLDLAQMESIISRVDAIYAQDFMDRGWKLEITLDRASSSKNAYAQVRGMKRQVFVSAALGNTKYMSEDHFALIICHEIGHHIGGAPFMTSGENRWASDEGQADYFATKECLRRVMIPQEDVPQVLPFVSEACAEQFETEDARHICERSAKAAELFGKRDYLLSHHDFEPDERYSKPIALENALRTDMNFRLPFSTYPFSQCRTDIMFQGALCNKEVCETGIGSRPRCWF